MVVFIKNEAWCNAISPWSQWCLVPSREGKTELAIHTHEPWWVLSARLQPVHEEMLSSVSPWALKQPLGTELLAWWVCIVAAAGNPYQGNTWGTPEVPQHSGGYMVNKTQLTNGSGFGGVLCQSKTKPLSKELLHLTLQLSVPSSEFNSPYHNTLVQWGLPGTNPNLKKK